MTIANKVARLAAIGGLTTAGFLALTATGASGQASPSPSPSQNTTTTAGTGSTTSTTRVVTVTTNAVGASTLARTGGESGPAAPAAALLTVGGAGTAITLAARRLARRPV